MVASLLEGARPQRRGLVTSLAAEASEVGALLAVGVAALTVGLLTPVDLDGWEDTFRSLLAPWPGEIQWRTSCPPSGISTRRAA